jgi:hypothetical protein
VSGDREWFAPKRYGYGAGLPITWQGWALTIAFVAIAAACAVVFRHKPLLIFAIMIPILTVFLVICARTTKGGWRWRWGEED